MRRRNPVNRRLRLLLMFLVAGFAVLLGRAAWLQAVQAGSLSQLAAKQHRARVVLPASRGTIFDRTGLQLAIGEQATTIYADPRQVRDPRAAATAAARILGVDANALVDQLSNRKASFVYVARKADPVKADRLGADGRRHLTLWQEPGAAVAPGDTFQVVAGCDKSAGTCRGKFSNFLNFRGFPHIPGDDWVTAYPKNGGNHDGASRES